MPEAAAGAGPFVWAVDVSQWNCAPYTQLDTARGAGCPAPGMAQFEQDVDALLLPHDPEAAAKVRRYLRPIDRVRSLVARLLPRIMYLSEGGATSCAWSDLRFAEEPEGKRPYLAAPKDLASIDYNLSHDGDWVVLAFTRSPSVRVGVDVMEISLPRYEESSASFCRTMELAMTRAERDWMLSANDDAVTLSRLYDVWTYKEAFTKAIGKGLGFDFTSVEVAFWEEEQGGPRLRIQNIPETRYAFTRISIPSGAMRQSQSAPGSRIVVAAGPNAAAGDHSVPLEAEEAKAKGILHMWSFDEVLRTSKALARVSR